MRIGRGRINDPAELSAEKIGETCEQDGGLVVQFSTRGAYDAAGLKVLNEACRLMGDWLQLRFYGHYGSCFDASVLRHVPEVRDLAVDCLHEITHEEEIGQLPHLKRLHVGVFELDRPDLLNMLDLGRIEHLGLSGNRKRNIDLSPLDRCQALTELFVHSHANGIHAVSGLPRLRKLCLGSYGKAHSLGFVADLPALEEMTLILGGRADIDDLSSATLKELQILRVRGLASLGDFSRLPALSALRVEDQIQLRQLDLHGAQLERLSLFNCRQLEALPGLEVQDRLREFAAGGVALDLDHLRDREWPAQTRSVSLFSGRQTWNGHARQRLAARGLDGEHELWL